MRQREADGERNADHKRGHNARRRFPDVAHAVRDAIGERRGAHRRDEAEQGCQELQQETAIQDFPAGSGRPGCRLARLPLALAPAQYISGLLMRCGIFLVEELGCNQQGMLTGGARSAARFLYIMQISGGVALNP
jgi:hypothetical protein